MSAPTVILRSIGSAHERRPTLSAGYRRLRAHYDVLAVRGDRVLVRYVAHADAFGSPAPTEHVSRESIWMSAARLRIRYHDARGV